jgi:glyoxylase-like metal-dependent hydrolase (beta-lactamase superfamily II)
VCYEGAVRALTDPAANAVRIRTRFPEHSPAPQSWLRGTTPDIILKDGDILEGRLQVIHTPGHDLDCVCWYDIPTKTLITGDSLQGNGTPTQGIGFYQSLSDYEYTLDRLSRLDVENIILGHEYEGLGDFILGKENAIHALSVCAQMTRKYDSLIRAYLSEGLSDPAEIATRLIKEAGCGMPEKLFLALHTVSEHLA